MADSNGRRTRTGSGLPGPGVDAQGLPVIDPTANVLETIKAAIQRQDDLRIQEGTHIREVLTLQRHYEQIVAELRDDIATLRGDFDRQFRELEANRVNAIRAVDVQAVTRAAEVSATQASTLAAQVATAAEAMRTQVANAQAAAEANLRSALEPIQMAISDLRKSQYELQGQRVAQVEGKGSSQWVIGVIVAAVLSIAGIVVAVILKS
jgi:hypothetical protein